MTGLGRRVAQFAVSATVVALLLLFARHVDWHGAVAAMRAADLRLVTLAVALNLASLTQAHLGDALFDFGNAHGGNVRLR